MVVFLLLLRILNHSTAPTITKQCPSHFYSASWALYMVHGLHTCCLQYVLILTLFLTTIMCWSTFFFSSKHFVKPNISNSNITATPFRVTNSLSLSNTEHAEQRVGKNEAIATQQRWINGYSSACADEWWCVLVRMELKNSCVCACVCLCARVRTLCDFNPSRR